MKPGAFRGRVESPDLRIDVGEEALSAARRFRRALNRHDEGHLAYCASTRLALSWERRSIVGEQPMSIKLYELVGKDEARPFSPHCWKVAFALAHKGLDFITAPTRFLDVPKIENGASTIVPLIRDGDRLVADSFAIAVYLEETYPDRPPLFAGEGGQALSRFIEKWSMANLHSHIGTAVLVDIHDSLGEEDRVYFRASREKRYGRPLEEVAAGRAERREAFRGALAPLRLLLKEQPFIGGRAPLFADHIVAGAFQWARVISPFRLLEDDDPVSLWFESCLDLYDGLGRKVPAA